MKYTTAVAILSLLTSSSAFVSRKNAFSRPSLTTVDSTLAPDTPDTRVTEDDSQHFGALSMQIDELAEVLGGKGRAQIVWDCYSIVSSRRKKQGRHTGLKPSSCHSTDNILTYFNTCTFYINQGIEPTQFHGDAIQLGYDDFESVYSMLPSQRRSQRLGPDALSKLETLYSKQGGKVEGGVASLSYISRAGDSTTKLLLKLSDGLEIETVIIPWKGQRSTLCMSTQVGCRQGCKFCATGRMGRIRNLTTDEILAQMFYAKKICRLEGLPEVSNIVFMGMGESADNAENVVKATEILTTRELFQLAAAKVTVSTVGPSPEAFKSFAKAPCVIAWSVHAANDELRRKLVPTTKYTMAELRQGMIDALLERNKNLRTTMLEVALMKGVNDSIKEADELVEFARVITDSVPGCKLMVNLIPFNDIGNTEFERPDPEDVKAFQMRLQEQGLFAHIRTTRGDDKTAACGQLSTKKGKLP
jgi:23S rRNA (adenine2503-C2)-methyltransferase